MQGCFDGSFTSQYPSEQDDQYSLTRNHIFLGLENGEFLQQIKIRYFVLLKLFTKISNVITLSEDLALFDEKDFIVFHDVKSVKVILIKLKNFNSKSISKRE